MAKSAVKGGIGVATSSALAITVVLFVIICVSSPTCPAQPTHEGRGCDAGHTPCETALSQAESAVLEHVANNLRVSGKNLPPFVGIFTPNQLSISRWEALGKRQRDAQGDRNIRRVAAQVRGKRRARRSCTDRASDRWPSIGRQDERQVTAQRPRIHGASYPQRFVYRGMLSEKRKGPPASWWPQSLLSFSLAIEASACRAVPAMPCHAHGLMLDFVLAAGPRWALGSDWCEIPLDQPGSNARSVFARMASVPLGTSCQVRSQIIVGVRQKNFGSLSRNAPLRSA
jgi:hypothetical protein